MGLFGKYAGAGARADTGGAGARGGAVGRVTPLGDAGLLAKLEGMASDVCDVRLHEVRKSFSDKVVLDDVSLTLTGGGKYCLMAPSGSGKTTLIRVLLGLETHDSGAIEGLSTGRMSMMFQEDRLCEVLSAVENVALVLPGEVRRADVAALLAEVLPADALDKPVMQLSGGMRRRVSLVRAMAYPSDVVVLDEPFTGLDTATRRHAIDFVLRHLCGRTLLVATHGENDAHLLGAETIHLTEVQGPEVRTRMAGRRHDQAGSEDGARGADGTPCVDGIVTKTTVSSTEQEGWVSHHD